MYLLYLVALLTVFVLVSGVDDDEIKARGVLDKINAACIEETNEYLELLWNYETDENNETLIALQNYTDFPFQIDGEDLPWETYKDYDISREAKLYGLFRHSNIYLDEASSNLDNSIDEMANNYLELDLCQDKPDCDNNDAYYELFHNLANSTDPSILLENWKLFNDLNGPAIRPLFEKYVDIANNVSRLEGFPSRAEDWLSEYEQDADKVESSLKDIYQTLRPLYDELHAYIRLKMNSLYGDSVVHKSGSIPVHVLGSLVSEEWQILYSKVKPYDNVMDYTEKLYNLLADKLINDSYTPQKMFKLAESFFTSLSLKPMTDIFWSESLIEKPKDKVVACGSSAWDFFKENDFRIQHCTEITPCSLFTVYKLMCDVEYYMHYANLPAVYREAPNGLGCAVPSTVQRSLTSFKYFSKLKLIEDYKPSQEEIINTLMYQALYYVPNSIYSYTLDVYRRGIFRGQILKNNYNTEYWNLRETLSGVSAPEKRSESVLDAAADYMVVTDTNVNMHFNRIILSFQIFKTLCIAAKEYDPAKPDQLLSQCDFSGSEKAGEILSKIMKLGQSKPLNDILKEGIGQENLDASGMVEFFNPLLQYLKEYNAKAGVKPGF